MCKGGKRKYQWDQLESGSKMLPKRLEIASASAAGYRALRETGTKDECKSLWVLAHPQGYQGKDFTSPCCWLPLQSYSHCHRYPLAHAGRKRGCLVRYPDCRHFTPAPLLADGAEQPGVKADTGAEQSSHSNSPLKVKVGWIVLWEENALLLSLVPVISVYLWNLQGCSFPGRWIYESSSSISQCQDNCTVSTDSLLLHTAVIKRQASMLLFPGINAEDLLICATATAKSVAETVPLLPFVDMTHLDPVNHY